MNDVARFELVKVLKGTEGMVNGGLTLLGYVLECMGGCGIVEMYVGANYCETASNACRKAYSNIRLGVVLQVDTQEQQIRKRVSKPAKC